MSDVLKMTLELTESQANIIRTALDAYSRLLGGQLDVAVGEVLSYWMLCQDTSGEPKEARRGRLREAELGSCIDSDKIGRLAAEAKQELYGLERGSYYSISAPEIPDRARQAYDLLQVIRHALAWHCHPGGPRSAGACGFVDFGDPYRTAVREEPLAKCKISKE